MWDLLLVIGFCLLMFFAALGGILDAHRDYQAKCYLADKYKEEQRKKKEG